MLTMWIIKHKLQFQAPNYWWNMQFRIWEEYEYMGGVHYRIKKYIKILPHWLCKRMMTWWG